MQKTEKLETTPSGSWKNDTLPIFFEYVEVVTTWGTKLIFSQNSFGYKHALYH